MGSDADWQKVRRKWVVDNPPNHQGQYVCGICAKTVHIAEMELDHIIPRSGAPQSFAEYNNLQPAHGFCNQQKSSRRLKPKISAEEYQLRRDLGL